MFTSTVLLPDVQTVEYSGQGQHGDYRLYLLDWEHCRSETQASLCLHLCPLQRLATPQTRE